MRAPDPDTLGLDPDTLEARVRSLAADGYGAHEIASLLRLHVQLVRRIVQTSAADREEERADG